MSLDTSRELVSRLGGSWYEADPKALRATIEGYLEAAADTPALEGVSAILVPHAGYAYSGPVAACALRQVRGRTFRRVVVLGPTHRYPMRNTAAVPDAGSYRTVLGEIPLDTEFLGRLVRHKGFAFGAAAQGGEHSVEIEFPMLQVALGSFRLAPIVVGQLDEATARGLAGVLLEEIDDQTLVVVSSDFTHYGRDFDYVPFTEEVPENLRKLDLGAFEKIREKDFNGFRGYVAETGATICGRDAISILLAMLGSAQEVHLLRYDNSGNGTGDWRQCVSYVSAAITGPWKSAPAAAPGPSAANRLPLSPADKQALLTLARGTLTRYLETGRRPAPEDLGVTVTANMRQVAGAFVTLTEGGELRGCIGEIFPQRPLYEAVMDHALNAALKDPRFPRVRKDELPALHLEISALTPPHAVDSWRDIVIGRDGMVLQKNGRSAVFLPQVAPEQGWDLETTLTYLSRKAGLAPDAWKEGARFEVFQAVVFGEARK